MQAHSYLPPGVALWLLHAFKYSISRARIAGRLDAGKRSSDSFSTHRSPQYPALVKMATTRWKSMSPSYTGQQYRPYSQPSGRCRSRWSEGKRMLLQWV